MSFLFTSTQEENKHETLLKGEEEKSNFLSHILFLYASKLFYKVFYEQRKDKNFLLEPNDFWTLPKQDHTLHLSEKFEDLLKKNISLRNSLWTLVRRDMIIAGVLRIFLSASSMGSPLLLRQLLMELQSVKPNYSMAYGWAGILGFIYLFAAILENNYYWYTSRAGWQIRSTISSAVYAKALRLSIAARQTKTIGEIVNYMQLDAQKMSLFTDHLHEMWDAPLQVIGFTIVLYFIIGWPCFVGLAVTFLSMPVMVVSMITLARLDRKTMMSSDNRVKTTNEAIQSMFGVKVSSWEDAIIKIVESIRALEVSYLYQSLHVRAIVGALMASTPALSAVCALAVYVIVVDGSVTPAILFSALNAFSLLRGPLMLLPMASALAAQAQVSSVRVNGYLVLEEITEHAIDENNNDPSLLVSNEKSDPTMMKKDLEEDPDLIVFMENASFCWTKQANEVPVLHNINLKIKKGELIAIVGTVGCGKTALLDSILNETHLVEGKNRRKSPICAYASQTAWILNATIRENIIFHAEFDRERYERVIEVSQLAKDIDLLPEKDLTEIGERGVSVSGGQRQRISVARAAYWALSANRFVILDDVLSALDPEVGNKLFHECILDFLKDTTRIVVTNQLDDLEQYDRIIMIGNNTIEDQGTYSALIERNVSFSRLMEHYFGTKQNSGNKTEKKLYKRSDFKRFSSVTGNITSEHIMQVEERETGAVKSGFYGTYIKAGGGYFMFFLVQLAFLFMQGGFFVNTIWVTWWTNDAVLGYPSDGKNLTYYLVGYAITAILLFFGSYIRILAIYRFGIKATTNLHKVAFISILHAKMSFFETTPVGRILQRFSRDVRELDFDLPENLSMVLFAIQFVFISLITICVVTPIFIAFVFPFSLVLLFFLILYRPVMRDAKRLGSISLSPVYALFSETLGGLSSLRAYCLADEFIKKEYTLIDRSTRLYGYAQKLCERWVAIRAQAFAGIVIMVACLLAVQAVSTKSMTAGDAGLSISYALVISNMLTMLTRSLAVLEASMNSVERLDYVIKQTPQEKWQDIDYPKELLIVPPKDWPNQGGIRVENLSLKYRENTAVILNNISFTIKPREKIGIVGRSGSGKSSLFTALLRIVEPIEGSKMYFDDLDVSRMKLSDLRSKIGVAPQFPVLFSGTIRSNVDPFKQYSDLEVNTALEDVGLKMKLASSMKGLDSVVSESGENFSKGEQQLISLSRILLKKPKIILLDEATANLDHESDELIQTKLRENFAASTVLVIAHRLRTIITSDRILVLAPGGFLAEFDEPNTLLQNPNSQLSLTIAEMGEKQANFLRDISSKKFSLVKE